MNEIGGRYCGKYNNQAVDEILMEFFKKVLTKSEKCAIIQPSWYLQLACGSSYIMDINEL